MAVQPSQALAGNVQLRSSVEPSQRFTLEDFSNEILDLILEELFILHPSTFRSLVAVSKKLSYVATPFLYHTITLRPSLLGLIHHGDPVRAIYISKIYTHTKHISIQTPLNWNLASGFLAQCKNLERLYWGVWDDVYDSRAGLFQKGTAQALLPALIQQFLVPRPNIALFLLNCNHNYWGIISVLDMYKKSTAASVPIQNIASINNHSSVEENTLQFAGAESGHRNLHFLSLLTNLKSLSLPNFGPQSLYDVATFFATGNLALPPVKELELWNFQRLHNESPEGNQIWNLSRLQTLTFHPPPHDFLSSLIQIHPPPPLIHLKLNSPIYVKQESTTILLSKYLHYLSPILETLEVRCQLLSFDITSLTRHKNLRTLAIYDYAGYSEIYRGCPTLTPSSLAAINSSCPHLAKLCLDFDSRKCNFAPDKPQTDTTLITFTQFRNLDALTLEMPSQLINHPTNPSIQEDLDLSFSKSIVSFLSNYKAGKRFEKIEIETHRLEELNEGRIIPLTTTKIGGWDVQRLFKWEWDWEGRQRFKEAEAEAGLS